MIKLKAGTKTNLNITVTQKGMPVEGEVSFGIYDSSGEVIFSETQEIEGGKLSIIIPKIHENNYSFTIETDEGYSDVQELNVYKSLRKGEKIVDKTYQLDIDNERDEKYEKNIGKNKVLMNEFYINNGKRLKKIESDIAEYGEKQEIRGKEVDEKIEQKTSELSGMLDSFSKDTETKVSTLNTKIDTLEESINDSIEGLENYVDLQDRGILLQVEQVSGDVENIKKNIGVLSDSVANKETVSSLIESIKKAIPAGGVLDYSVDDTKVGNDILRTSDKIDKRIKGEVARRSSENQGLHYTTDINDDDTALTTTRSSTKIQSELDALSVGGISDGDKGDITVSGTGTVWTINNEVVTFAKMQHIATNRILGRSTAGTGDIEPLADSDARTIMGLATTDSPQFAGINLGHATDTTITRVSAGVIAVEGATLATQAYAEGLFASNDAMIFRGVIDCSANPNYPAADTGHLYKVSVAGKIGGASGINVEVGDSIICAVDGTASGDQATVGANWYVIQVNLDGAVIGPASSTDGYVVLFDGTTGKLIKNSTLNPANLLQSSDIGVAVQGYDADTTKNDVANTFTQPQRFPQADTASSPAIQFGDGDTGFYEQSDDVVGFSAAGTRRAVFDSEGVKGGLTAGQAHLINEVSSATNPVRTFVGDADTGVGRGGADNLSLIAGGTEIVDITTSGETINGTQRVTGGLEVNAQTGTTYTLVLGDAGKVVTLSNASAITLTVPTNASVAFPTGAIINLEQHGAGQVTVAAAGGVTINSKGGNLKLTGQRSGAYLRKTASDTRILVGDLSA